VHPPFRSWAPRRQQLCRVNEETRRPPPSPAPAASPMGVSAWLGPMGSRLGKNGEYSKEEVCSGRRGGEAPALFSIPGAERGLRRARGPRAGRCGHRLCPPAAPGAQAGPAGQAQGWRQPAPLSPAAGTGWHELPCSPPSPLHPEICRITTGSLAVGK